MSGVAPTQSYGSSAPAWRAAPAVAAGDGCGVAPERIQADAAGSRGAWHGAVALTVRGAVAELDGRAADLTGKGERLWKPAAGRPALVIVVDEYAELPEDAHRLADSIARRGRAVAVTLLVATQRPTQAAMGHSAVRSQMDVRVCLRVRERRDTDLVLGQGMYADGW